MSILANSPGTAATITLAMRANQAQMAQAQSRIAGGYKVATPLDEPRTYFAAANARQRADGLEALVERFSLAERAVEAGASAMTAIERLIGEMERVIADAPTTTPAPAPPTGPQSDAATQALLDASGLTATTDIRTIPGLSFDDDSYTYAFSEGRTPVTHRWGRDGWTVGDLMNTINGAGSDVTAALDAGRLVLTSAAGDALALRSGQAALPQEGLAATVYNGNTKHDSIADALGLIDPANSVATFRATYIDYPNAGTTAAPTTGWRDNDDRLQNLLGVGAADFAGEANHHYDRDLMVLEGQITVAAGTHTFDALVNDSLRLEIDGATVFSHDQTTDIDQFGVNLSGSVTLAAGTYDIRILHFERFGEAGFRVRSSLTGGDALDSSVLSSGGAVPTYDTTLAPVVPPTGGTDADALARLDDIRAQVEALVADAGVSGVNLPAGDGLDTVLNLRGTRIGLTIDRLDTSLFDLSGLDLTNADAVQEALGTVREAVVIQSSQLAAANGILQAREDFTGRVVQTLRDGADALTLADPNAESARFLALQTRNELAATALSMAAEGAGRTVLLRWAELEAR